ncbi:MAG: DNRLRE domain-containing protein, partial [Planctomycetota bacterium]|nr:DNRLRE domain-containing protein [Planctomycetota bacterium]
MKARTASLLWLVVFASVSVPSARAGEPLEVPAAKDVTAYSANAAEQWKGEGARENVQIGFSKDGQMRVFLAFDLADAAARPCGAAVLHLQTEECWPNKDAATIQVHRLLRPFSESVATWGHSMEGDQWANPGGDFDPVPVCGRRLTKKEEGKVLKEIEIDVTPLVQAWLAMRFPNYG